MCEKKFYVWMMTPPDVRAAFYYQMALDLKDEDPELAMEYQELAFLLAAVSER